MNFIRTRRERIRLISYTAAALLLAAALAFAGWASARRWRTRLENVNQRAWAELTEYLADIEAALNKVLYTNSLPEQASLTARLLRDAGCAKAALGQLPLADEPVTEVYRFLSQAGEYAQSLTVQLASGAELDAQSAENLLALYRYANELNTALSDYRAQNGTIAFTAEPLALQAAAQVPDITDGFRSAADGLESYPTLIYDGPFADRVEQQSPRATAGMHDFGQEVALRSAEGFLTLGGLSYGALTAGDRVGGNLPCYRFTDGTVTLDVSCAGALPVRFTNARAVDVPRMDAEQAVTNACVFLASQGEHGFQQSYYAVSGGVLTVNFVAEQGNVRCYPDQIKVSVAMDTGEIVEYDAAAYVMNHTERALNEPRISAEEAAQKLSTLLSISPEEPQRAVIPTSGGGEADCYEFCCLGVNGETVLVYLDTADGRERQILILLQSDGGTFVM